jgi:hypothetical protein
MNRIARLTMGGYSLEGLTRDLNISTQKISMKDRFSAPKIRKDGTEGCLLSGLR